MKYAEALGISGSIFVTIIIILFAAELFKAISYIYGIIASHTSKGKKIYMNRKNIDKLCLDNNAEITAMKEIQAKTTENLNSFIKTQGEFNAAQQEVNASTMEFINNQNVLNDKIDAELKEVKNRLSDISETVISSQLQQMRTVILEFASICTLRRFTKERFASVTKTYEEYESVIKKKGLVNSEIDVSYNVIASEYQRCIEEHDFLEDHGGETERKTTPKKSTTKKKPSRRTATNIDDLEE